jgi:phosphotriesterase-related protein
MDWVEAAGAPLSAWIWVHANVVQETAPLLVAAERGAWISLDGVAAERQDHVLRHLNALRTGGYLEHVLLSHDGDSYTVDGGLRPYEYLMTGFIPLLKENGYSDTEIHQLTVANPAPAFAINIPT